MQHLELPEFDHQIKKQDDKLWIFDILRKKYIFLTPEEWVRQNLIHHLIQDHHYPKALIKVETGLKYHVLKAQYIMVTNGQHYLVYATHHETKQYELVAHIPTFPAL